MSENTEKASGIIIAIIFVAVFLAVMILALVLILNSVLTASQNINGIVYSSGSATNESGWINQTGFTLQQSYNYSTSFTPTIVSIVNNSGSPIASGNWTLTGRILTNKTATTYPAVKITYTFIYDNTLNDTISSTAINSIQNNILSMVINFFALAPTIGTIFAVCILIAGIVLLVVYVRKMKDKESSEAYYG